MAHFVESLESRRLLSASGAVGVLQADGKALAADVKALGKTEIANLKLVAADVKAAGNSKIAKAPIKTLDVGSKAAFNLLSKGTSKTLSSLTRDVKKGEALVRQLTRKPGNATAEAKLSAVIMTLQTDASTGLATITTQLAALGTADSTNIVAVEQVDTGDAKLASDLSTNGSISTTSTSNNDIVTAAANQTLTTDVAAVVAEARGV